jgi:predicted dehydrogenase
MRRIIQVGVGGYGRTWLDTVAQFPERAAYAALVDSDQPTLAAASARTGVPADRCFSSLRSALNGVEADAVLCVVPPAHHEAVLVEALDAGLHVLSEKPIADTMEASRRVVERGRAARGTFMVSQKGRFHKWVRRFRQAIEAEEVGPLSHLTLHYRAPLFRWGQSGFRHRMADPLLVEMSIHHFDLIRALLRRDPVDVAGFSWNTPWSDFAGDVAASLRFTMEGGVPVIYEAYCRSSGDLTSWYGDIRAECADGAVTMVFPQLYLAGRGADQLHVSAPRQDLMRVGDLQEGQTASFREFLDAIDQRRAPESSATENLTSVAMVFAAADACRSGERRLIADYVGRTETEGVTNRRAPRPR